MLLPGDATPDPVLQQRSSVTPDEWSRLHSLFIAGGPENADGLLAAFSALAEESPEALAETKPFQRFGYWTPEGGMAIELSPGDRPAVPLLFYRAALEGAGTATLEALYAEMLAQGLQPVPLMISTLKEAACVRFVKMAFAAHKPQAILNLTGFALGLDGLDEKLNPFAETDAPVIQLVQGGRPAAQWAADSQGLSAKDLAMQVVLPELDGRIGGIIVGHKAEAVWHEATQCPLSAYAPDADGIARAVALAKNWVRLRATPRAERRVAHRARQLPDPRRPPRQRRRLRRAGRVDGARYLAASLWRVRQPDSGADPCGPPSRPGTGRGALRGRNA